MKLANKIVLVTGACGQLGRQFCSAFVREGASVWVSDLMKDDCKKTISGINYPGEYHSLAMDVSSPKSVKKGFAEIKKVSGHIDVIVNNAGIGVFAPFEKRAFEDFMRVMKVNAGGTFLCIQEGSRLMRQTKTRGSIINIGSIYGMVSGDPKIYTDCSRITAECYGASKAAVIQMTRYFSVFLSDYGIRVNCISPGGVFNNQGKDFVKRYSERTPMGRMAGEKEIAATAVFLASGDAGYITGQNIAVDGGWTAW